MPLPDASQAGRGCRVGCSLFAFPPGALLFLASFFLLWWNEGRAVRAERSLAEGSRDVVSVGADKVDEANNDRLIHLTAKAVTDDAPADPDFGVQAPGALRLVRKVEMYQYKEEAQDDSGPRSRERHWTYTYTREWSEAFHDSNKFHDPHYQGKNPGQSHQNP